MKKVILGAIALAGVAACTPMPQTAEEMRSVVKGGAFLSDQSSQVVSRNYSSVLAGVRAGAAKCMNGSQASQMTYRPMPGYAPVTQTMVAYYSTDMKSSGGKTELTMRKKMQGAKVIGGGADNSGLAYLVDITPTSGGTRLDFYGGKIGYKDLNEALVRWAQGGSTRCPDLP